MGQHQAPGMRRASAATRRGWGGGGSATLRHHTYRQQGQPGRATTSTEATAPAMRGAHRCARARDVRWGWRFRTTRPTGWHPHHGRRCRDRCRRLGTAVRLHQQAAIAATAMAAVGGQPAADRTHPPLPGPPALRCLCGLAAWRRADERRPPPTTRASARKRPGHWWGRQAGLAARSAARRAAWPWPDGRSGGRAVARQTVCVCVGGGSLSRSTQRADPSRLWLTELGTAHVLRMLPLKQ